MKHNQVSVRRPLGVTIRGEDGNWLVVCNNLQPKRVAAPSNGLGLANIAAKYKILHQPDVLITKEADAFTVKVPLIDPNYA